MDDTYTIREVQKCDLPALVEIEQQRWAREKIGALSLSELTQWYETKSPYFLVALKSDVPVGFYYGIQINFEPHQVHEFTSPDAHHKQGYTGHTHDPSGTTVYGINVVAITSQAGALLNAEVHKRLHEMKIAYFIGLCRLPHLDFYLKDLESKHGGVLPYNEYDIALWYAHQTIRQIGAKVWPQCTKEPNVLLPQPKRPDTILKFHVQGTTGGLLGVVANYLEDPKSRNYGACVASQYPHT